MTKNSYRNKSITIFCGLIILINFGLFYGMAADFEDIADSEYSGSSRDTGNNDDFDNAEPILPGSHNGSVDATTDPMDIYKIHLNGGAVNADEINISVNTTSAGMGIMILYNPDILGFAADWVWNTFNGSINQTILTTGTHYIIIYSAMGTADYWLNFTVTQTSNPQFDGNNDFGNATTANDGDSLVRSYNETYNYFDIFKINVPKNMNITITADPTEDLELELYLYEEPNSTGLIYQGESWAGERVAAYNDSSNKSGWYYVYVKSPNWIGEFTNSGTYIINFTIRPPNLAPQIDISDPRCTLWNTNNGIIIQEDVTAPYVVELPQHFTDDNKPSVPGKLNFWYEGDDSNIGVTIHANDSVSFTPAENWFGGPVTFTFYANDSVFQCNDTLNVTVQPVNDPPELRLTVAWEIKNGTFGADDTILMSQGSNTTLKVSATDVDLANPNPDTLYYTATFYSGGSTNLTALPVNFSIEETTGMIHYRSSNDEIGSFYIIVEVRDRSNPDAADIGTDSRTIEFKITNVNDRPEITNIAVNKIKYIIDSTTLELENSAIQDEYFDFILSATDPDFNTPNGESLTFSASNEFILFPATIPTMVKVTALPTNNDAMQGYLEGEIFVRDDENKEDSLILKIPVTNVNDPPEITNVKDFQIPSFKLVHFMDSNAVIAGEYLNFTIQASDIDTIDTLTFNTENTSMTIGSEPEISITQNPMNRSALVSFHPSETRGDTVLILNLTVTDSGKPALSDWVNVKINIVKRWVVEAAYTLTSNDCNKLYEDDESDVFTYERATDERSIKASKGDHNNIDIISLNSRKFNENLIVTVTCGQNIEDIGLLTDLNVYVVKSSFIEYGPHLEPENMDKANWDNLPFVPSDTDTYSGLSLEKFSASDSGELNGNTWTITTSLESFENTFGVSHDTGFELFATSFDGSELQFVVGDLTNLFGPKSYDSAGYNAAKAPDISKPVDGGGGIIPIDMDDTSLFLIIIVIVIIVIIVIVLAVVLVRKKGKEKAREEPQVLQAAPPQAPAEVICTNCNFLIIGGAPICPACGAAAPPPLPTPPGVPCIYCQTIIPPGTPNCPNCNAQAPSAPPEGEGAAGAAPPQPPAAPAVQPQYPQYQEEQYQEPPQYPPQQQPPQQPQQQYYPQQQPVPGTDPMASVPQSPPPQLEQYEPPADEPVTMAPIPNLKPKPDDSIF